MYNDRITNDEASQFKRWYLVGEEAITTSRVLAINQGLSSTLDGVVRFSNNFEVFIREKINEGSNNDNPRAFKFQEFMESLQSNNEYAQEMITLYGESQTGVNPLTVIANASDFQSMIDANFTSKQILDGLTYNSKLINYWIDLIADARLEPSGFDLKENDVANIQSFVHDFMIDAFLKNHSSSVYQNELGKKVKINNNMDRKKFVEFIENSFIPRMKTDEKLSTNAFIQDFVKDQKTDYETGEKYNFYKLLYNVSNTPTDVQALRTIIYRDGLRELTGFSFDGNNVFHMLFMYNLIISRQSMRRESFSKFMDFAVENNSSTPSNNSGIRMLNDFFDMQSTMSKLPQDELINIMNLQDAKFRNSLVATLMLQYGFAKRIYKKPVKSKIASYPRFMYLQTKTGRKFYEKVDNKEIKEIALGSENKGFISKRFIPVTSDINNGVFNFNSQQDPGLAKDPVSQEEPQVEISDFEEILNNPEYLMDCE